MYKFPIQPLLCKRSSTVYVYVLCFGQWVFVGHGFSRGDLTLHISRRMKSLPFRLLVFLETCLTGNLIGDCQKSIERETNLFYLNNFITIGKIHPVWDLHILEVWIASLCKDGGYLDTIVIYRCIKVSKFQ